MKRAGFCSVVMVTAGCMSAAVRGDRVAVARIAAPALAPADNDDLAREASLAQVLRLVRARHPDLRAGAARMRAALATVEAQNHGLPDLELKLEPWGVPLATPARLDRSQMLMAGLRQAFPALGSREARAQESLAEAGLAAEERRARELDLIEQARQAYFAFVLAEAEYRIHQEHVDIATQLVDIARASYQAGRATQQDVLRTIVERSRLHADIATIEQHRDSYRALLNVLMARPPDAPLAVPAELEAPAFDVALESLESALDNTPEVQKAARAVEVSRADLAAEESEGLWPAVVLGADYQYMASVGEHAYSAMVALSLPWLNPRHGDRVDSAEARLLAAEFDVEGARNQASYALHSAHAHLLAVARSLAIVDQDLLPQARQSYETARASFASGRADALGLMDALRAYLDVRLERVRTLVEAHVAVARLERVAGVAEVVP